MVIFLETIDVDDGNFLVKCHTKYYFVTECGGPQEVGGDSTQFGPL